MRSAASAALVIACIAVTATSAQQLADSIELQIDDCVQTPDEACLYDLVETDVLSNYIFNQLAGEAPERISISAIRRDLQLGSFGSGAASTSVVAAPGVSDIVSAAVESGTVLRKTDGEALTLSINALPVGQLMAGRIPLGCGTSDETCREGAGRWIRGLSGSVSLASTSVSATATAEPPIAAMPESAIGFLRGTRRLQSGAIRYEWLVRERNHQRQQEALNEAAETLRNSSDKFLSVEAGFQTQMDKVLKDSGWRDETEGILIAYKDSRQALRQVLLERYQAAYRIVMASQELSATTAAVTELRLQVIREQNRLLAEKLYRKAFTVDYLHERPTDQPQYHRLRLVLSTPLGRKPDKRQLGASPEAALPPVNLALNGSVSFYRERRDGTYPGRLRDTQVSAAVDWSPSARGSIVPTYTAAYYFQYMHRNGEIEFNRESVTPGPSSIPLTSPAIEVLETKGAIHVVQFRVSIQVGSSGVSFPAAISYASRSELITGRTFWQGHAGISYDLSALKALVQ